LGTRIRKGFDLHAASSIAIVYKDQDENYFKTIRKIAKELKDTFSTKHIMVLGWIDGTEKEVPIYQAHKLEIDYFTKDDLSWKLQASNNLQTFINEDYDILIDLVSSNDVQVDFVIAHSQAKMKVGRKGSSREKSYDFIVAIGEQSSTEQLFNEIVKMLSKLKLG
jgi:hypothetical protein